MLLKCSKCERIWNYKGKKPKGAITTCPDYKHSVKIEEYTGKIPPVIQTRKNERGKK